MVTGSVTFGNDKLFAEVTGVPQGNYTTTLYGDAASIFVGAGGIVKCGNDTLIAGKSDVTMWGDVKTISNSGGTVNNGVDTFVFDLCNGIGKDTIADFEGIALGNNDFLKFHGVTSSNSAFSTVVNNGGNIQLDFGGGQTITFSNIAHDTNTNLSHYIDMAHVIFV
ncbi:MAG: hypothetical protein K2Y18_03275 [Alphaproteobacteria bacterium]|nr:hypothetical protein [Alphaproteobacteria bacterium]